MDKVVYIHRKKTNGEVFYVGIGNPNRPYNKDKRTEFWKKVADKHGREVEIVRTGLSWEDACDIEMDLIELIGRRDLGLGTLVNLTDGGEGGFGYIVSEEVKAKMSESKKKNWANGDNLGRSKEVIDTSTGIKYKSLKTACNELGHNLTTIAEQLRNRKPRKWNTLRQVGDLMEDYIPKRNKCKPIPFYAVIDVNTNKIYNSITQASKYFPTHHSNLSKQITGKIDRQPYNTLHTLKDLVIHSNGYETKEQAKLRKDEEDALETLRIANEQVLNEMKEAKRLKKLNSYYKGYNIINVATGYRFRRIGIAVKSLGIEKNRYRDIKMQMKGLKPRDDDNTLYYTDML